MTILDSRLLMENGESCVPSTPEEEKRIVMELMTAAELNLKEGNIYYVLSNRWFNAWQRYVGNDSDDSFVDDDFVDSQHMNINSSRKANRPHQIDNSDLILKGSTFEGDDLELLTLQEGHDYVLVPQTVWQKLFEWYKGGPALPRKLISQGDFHKQFNVEVYPLRLVLNDSRDDSQSIIRLSKKASLQDLYERVCEYKKIKQEEAQIWDYFNREKHSILITSGQALGESNLQMGQDILLEVHYEDYWQSVLDSPRNDLALVPFEPLRSSITIAGGAVLSCSSDSCSNMYQGSPLTSTFSNLEDEFDSISTTVEVDWKGLAGLQNLGNTCFMNSAIQCLVHTPPLVRYFLHDYTDQINKDNPLGMHGELALAFGELLRKLWSSGRTSIAPRAFKGKLARFAPQFSGYNQHDSQELLAFLLDGLHEDLNRVKQKPYIEAKDSDGFPDEIVAEECWMNHKARNDSVIVDVCQGQYKSTLICPVCGKVSITFDPFMYLSLPLPSTTTRAMTVTIFYGDGSGLPMPFTVTVLKHGCCKDLASALSAACCLRLDETLLFAEVYENRIYRYFENPLEPLSSIKDDEHIVAYRVPKNCLGLTKIEILHRCSENVRPGERKLLGTPLVTYIEEAGSGGDIEIGVERVMSPFRRNTCVCRSKYESGKGNGDAVDEETCSGLRVSDERGVMLRGMEEEVKGDKRVTVDWGKKEHKLYDASYLRDLPEVWCKGGSSGGLCAKKTKQEAISLFSCLEAFLREEPLGPDDMWYCPKCREHRQASKKLDLWRLPDILVFHLKRFSYSRYMKNKLDTFVNFPIHDLDLSEYVKRGGGGSNVYGLYAISNHYGGLGGGHYSAHAKLIDDETWYHFDDSHVSAVEEEDVRTSAAYVLFYRRTKQ